MDKIYQIIIDRPIGYIDKFGNQTPSITATSQIYWLEMVKSKMFTSFPKLFGSL